MQNVLERTYPELGDDDFIHEMKRRGDPIIGGQTGKKEKEGDFIRFELMVLFAREFALKFCL